MNLPKPDPGWLPFLKITYGFIMLVIVAALAGVIALGHVEEKTSYGLREIIEGMLILLNGFSSWAFQFAGSAKETKSVDEEKSRKPIKLET